MNQIKAIIISALCCLSLTGKAQEITSLDFPYTEDYKFTLSGSSVYYDKYFFPSEEDSHRVEYRSYNISQKKDATNMTFDVRIIEDRYGEDTNTIYKSDLTIDSKGMKWRGLTESNKKEKYTQAIHLPLEEGTTWSTNFDGEKAKMLCFSTDTTINTYLGKVKGFGIRYTMVSYFQGGAYYHELEEYYHPVMGKIATEEYQYLLLDGQENRKMLFKQHTQLTYTNLSEEKLALVEFLP